MNDVKLWGHVGGTPDTKTVNGKTVTKFSLATSKKFTRDGETVTATQWHRIEMWDKLAETAAAHVQKGTPLIIGGEIRYGSYEREGHTVYTTDIVAHSMFFTGKKEDSKPEPKPETNEGKFQKSGKVSVNSMSDVSELPGNVADYSQIPDDDLPF
jgi:single-strand DNA-binding protein